MAAPTRLTAVPPSSTYRLQLHEGFPLARVAELADYLHALGVGSAYLSPVLTARRKSLHGYDVTDPTRLNPEITTAAEFQSVAARLRDRGIGVLLDIVPNHLCVSDPDNTWWQDVLTHGQSSRYAAYFDIDWQSPDPGLHGKVALPILEECRSDAVAQHALTLRRADDRIVLDYQGMAIPLDPASVQALGDGGAPSDARLDAINRAASGSDEQRVLNALLDAQHYRLVSWRAAPPDINYRRFFDVHDLGAVRVEDPVVFTDTHAVPLELVHTGAVTGLRVDHIDGLRDPQAYLDRLQHAVQPDGDHPLFVVVEKILVGDEQLPRGWAVAGTTGYDALARCNDVLTDGEGEARFRAIHAAFTGCSDTFEQTAHESRRMVLATSLASDVRMLARQLRAIASQDGHECDLSEAAVQQAVSEVAACFPVYRTYVTPSDTSATAANASPIRAAVRAARRRNPVLGRGAFELVQRALLLEHNDDPTLRACREFTLRFQQLTGATMAKGIEDTAFYRWLPLVSRNEVGGTPGEPVADVEHFHTANTRRQREWPGGLSASSTHDTKHSEDVRARIRVLAEVPELWEAAVQRWHRMTASQWPDMGPESRPERVAEYLFYQTLIGVWPMDGSLPNAELTERVQEAMVKSVREAKWRTTWANPDTAYEAALHRTVEALLDSRGTFCQDVAGFVQDVMRPGLWSALAELVLKVTMPGVPDFYQGNEIWNCRLVDPDNRTAVDFSYRQELLASIDADADPAALLRYLAQHPEDDRTKLWVTSRALRFRRRHASHFATDPYHPLRAEGSRAGEIVTWQRGEGASAIVTVVPRRFTPRTYADTWRDTHVPLPADSGGRFRDAITGQTVAVVRVGGHPQLPLDRAFNPFPFALLETIP